MDTIPFSERVTFVTVIRFQKIDEQHTEVEITMLGYQPREEASPVYNLFRRGNALTLGWLYERFTAGPRQWE